VYGWIWRRLPGGLPGKLLGTALLAAATVLTLWVYVSPPVEDRLPFSDVTVEQDGGEAPPQGFTPLRREQHPGRVRAGPTARVRLASSGAAIRHGERRTG